MVGFISIKVNKVIAVVITKQMVYNYMAMEALVLDVFQPLNNPMVFSIYLDIEVLHKDLVDYVDSAMDLEPSEIKDLL